MADDDPHLLQWCRMGFVSGALLNWFAAAMFLWHKAHGTLLNPFTDIYLQP